MTTTDSSGVQRLFDQWAGQGRGDAMARGHWPAVSQIIDLMQLQPGEQCLDVGCGNGYAVRAMAGRVQPGGFVAGVDLSPEMVRLAQFGPNPENVRFQQAAAEWLPFESDRFDHLLSVEALYYMPDPKQVLHEWRRVLKPGGDVWVMVDFYRENPYCVSWPGLLGLPLLFLSEHEYRLLFEHAGFTNVKAERLYNPMPVDVSDFKPGWGYNAPDDVTDFRTHIGSLLISGIKAS